jgi:hypothetical protein
MLNTLTGRFDDKRTDVADLRAELRSFKAQMVSLSAGSGLHLQPELAIPVQVGGRAPEVNNDFIPSITSLRRDPAEQLVADVGKNIAGKSVSFNVERGLVRSGGDLAPKVQTV